MFRRLTQKRPMRLADSVQQSTDVNQRYRWEHLAEELIQAMMLPITTVALAELLLMLSDVLSRLSVQASVILAAISNVLLAQAPVLVAGVLVLATIRFDRTWAVLTAVVAAYVWLVSAASLADWIRPDLPEGSFSFGWLPAVAVMLLIRALWVLADRYRSARFGKRLASSSLRFFTAVLLSFCGGLFSGWLWTLLARMLEHLAVWIFQSSTIGLVIYGFLSRLLQPTGLHAVLNHVLWTQSGSHITSSGMLVTGDLNRFLAGDATAGMYTAGFYPVVIFIVSAVLLAIYLNNRAVGKQIACSVFVLAAVVSSAGGLSVAADYLILILSPVAFLATVLLSGLSFFLTEQLHILHGFALGPGLLDFLDYWQIASRPEYLLIIGGTLAIPAFLLTHVYLKLKGNRQKGKGDSHRVIQTIDPEGSADSSADTGD